MGEEDIVQFEAFAKLDLVIAEVLEARVHPQADRLLVLRIDVGGQERQIVAGIREHYAPADLIGRRIVVVKNLAPRTVRGESSQGMLLAAGAGDQIVLLGPDREIPAGSRVR